MELTFYKCNHCGQIIKKIKDTTMPVVCCGEKMVELKPNTVDAAREKHVPSVGIEKNKVYVFVGEAPHPMVETHYIEWVILLTNKGSYKYNLKPGEASVCEFYLRDGEQIEHVYAYCNIHGLWMV